jgi:hypothetical protein
MHFGNSTMATEWFYTKGDEEIGPVASKELKRMAGIGVLQPSDRIWKEGMPEWVPASTVTGLFPETPVPTAPQATPSLPPVPPPMPKQSSEPSNPPTESEVGVDSTDASKSISGKVANFATSDRVQGFVALVKTKWLALGIAGKCGSVVTSDRVQGFVALVKTKWLALGIAGKCGSVVVASVMTVAVLSVGVSSFKAVTGISATKAETSISALKGPEIPQGANDSEIARYKNAYSKGLREGKQYAHKLVAAGMRGGLQNMLRQKISFQKDRGSLLRISNKYSRKELLCEINSAQGWIDGMRSEMPGDWQ